MDDSVIMCDEIIESYDEDASAKPSRTTKQKLFRQNLMKNSNLQNPKFLYCTYIFINYDSIIDSC